MSNTTPIPSDKNDIAVATALAGEMLGFRLIYLEGGSGATQPVEARMIEAVKQNVGIPLVVGGGLRMRTMPPRCIKQELILSLWAMLLKIN